MDLNLPLPFLLLILGIPVVTGLVIYYKNRRKKQKQELAENAKITKRSKRTPLPDNVHYLRGGRQTDSRSGDSSSDSVAPAFLTGIAVGALSGNSSEGKSGVCDSSLSSSATSDSSSFSSDGGGGGCGD